MTPDKLKQFKHISKIIYFFMKNEKAKLLALIFITIAVGVLEMLSLGAMYPVMQEGVKQASAIQVPTAGSNIAEGIYVWVSEHLNTGRFFASSIILIFVTVIAFIWKVFHLHFYQNMVAKMNMNAKNDIFRTLKDAHYSFYLGEKQGRLIFNSAVGSESVIGIVLTSIELFSELLKAGFITLMLLKTTLEFTLILLALGFVYLFLYRRIILKYVNKASRKLLDLQQDQHNTLNEFISGIKVIRVFSEENNWEKKYNDIINTSVDIVKNLEIKRLLPSYILHLFMGVAFGLAGVIISLQSKEMILSLAPSLGLLIIAGTKLNGSFSLISSQIATITRHFPNVQACYDLITDTPNIEELNRKGLHRKQSLNSSITFDNVCFTYPNSTLPTLDKINITIQKNSTVALVGESGAGKSTILNLLLALYSPSKGQISIDNEDIKDINKDDLKKMIGFVPQEAFLFNGTLYENICFGGKYTQQEVENATKMANAHEFISALPDKYETQIGDKGSRLSGGQKQRISIARALLKKPEVLVFDEPTSALDNTSEKYILDTLNDISNKLTIIIVAHRLTTVQGANTIYVMKNGRVIESGSHSELITKDGAYTRLYQKESQREILNENN